MSEASRQIFWSESLQKLKWIQSQVEGSYKIDGTNSSWIELPYTTMPNDRIEVVWQYMSLPPSTSSYGIIWGGGDKKYGNWRTLACGVERNAAGLYNSNGGLGSFSSTGSVDTVVTSVGIANQQQDDFKMTMFIQNELSLNQGYTHQFTAKCWSCKIQRAGELVFDLVPCLCKGEVGLVNAVDGVFYGSKSSVPFIAGERA